MECHCHFHYTIAAACGSFGFEYKLGTTFDPQALPLVTSPYLGPLSAGVECPFSAAETSVLGQRYRALF